MQIQKTVKEAILRSLEDLQKPVSYMEIYNRIVSQGYYDFGQGKTPAMTVSAQVGDFIRKEDSRVKRIKQAGDTYVYYLAKYESMIDPAILAGTETPPRPSTKERKSYDERDLHRLLASYLKSTGVYSKTIFHEQSTYGRDSNQIWTHPDMVAIKFLKLQNKTSQAFVKSINTLDTFKMSSYELKREINSDSELKKAFFQAVSNSSWAHYGYLVALECSSFLMDEMERLNHSFGIGIIQLNSNPYKSKTLFQPAYRNLDFKTLDKLCTINKDFERFIEQTDKLMTADERYHKAIEKELDEFCDGCFTNDEEALEYCRSHNIPVGELDYDAVIE